MTTVFLTQKAFKVVGNQLLAPVNTILLTLTCFLQTLDYQVDLFEHNYSHMNLKKVNFCYGFIYHSSKDLHALQGHYLLLYF